MAAHLRSSHASVFCFLIHQFKVTALRQRDDVTRDHAPSLADSPAELVWTTVGRPSCVGGALPAAATTTATAAPVEAATLPPRTWISQGGNPPLPPAAPLLIRAAPPLHHRHRHRHRQDGERIHNPQHPRAIGPLRMCRRPRRTAPALSTAALGARLSGA